jgi:hypothetical protein
MAESKEARNKALVLQRLTFVPHSCPRSTNLFCLVRFEGWNGHETDPIFLGLWRAPVRK